ncbi:MAG: SufD family Fe-S cluster assembly protein [Gammaproteobacteria bacterium]|nr:SufD family Fe-S cluster assembly protein [Gammaproteobacteria bacterium]
METLERIFADFAIQGAAAGAEAARLLQARGLPVTRDEIWRHANLRALQRVPGFAPAGGERGALPGAQLPEPLEGFERVLLLNGRRVGAAGSPGAVAADSALPPAAAATPPEAAFDLLNRMFAPAPLTLPLTDGARLEILSLAVAAAGGAAYPRLSISVAPGAHAQLVERHVGGCGPHSLVCPSVAVSLGAGATLDHYRMQQCAADVLFLDTLTGQVDAGARWNVRTADCGAATSRSTALLRLAGTDAALDWQSLAIAHRGQHCDLLLRVEHAARGTRTDQQYRGICTEEGHAACSAEVRVLPQAGGARIAQSLRGLLEGVRAEIDLRPRLEIHTDEVQAAHGATTGRLDDTLLFYLLSRGLEPDTARALLRWAFLGDVLRHWSIAPLRRAAEHAAAGQLGTSVPEEPA